VLLGLPFLLQIALLHRRERAIHHYDAGPFSLHEARDFVSLG
jgi:hypothetical protein